MIPKPGIKVGHILFSFSVTISQRQASSRFTLSVASSIAGSTEFGRQPNAPKSLGCLLVILFSSVGSRLKKIVTSVDNVKAFLFEFEEFTPFPRSRLKSGNSPVGHLESFIELLELKITPSTIDLVKHWFLGAGSGMIQIIKSPLILLESIVDFPAA